MADDREDDRGDEHLASVIATRGHSEQAWQAARDACARLYQRHAPKLLAFLAGRVRRGDLEDLHQTIWERVWQHLPERFRGGNFRAWLYQIARNHLIDEARKKRADSLDDADDRADKGLPRPDDDLVERERMDALQRCLDQLDAPRAAVVRARLAGEGYPDVCQRLGLKPAQAHKLFHEAKAQLHACVERALT